MVAIRGKRAAETVSNGGDGAGSEYEKRREQRIRENMEKMNKLGIIDLSRKLKSKAASLKKRSSSATDPQEKTQSPVKAHEPARRSSRLKDMTPVNYSEQPYHDKMGTIKNNAIRIPKGSEPEIYTDEHVKLLGDCDASWTVLVDGYGEDGKRIYDSERGETCHQCRQKTLGLHTHCSKCNLVQGQLCGDCLYTRYGENVVEVNENPNWICPVCRDICNCSICRKAKGWAPTGQIAKKVVRLGFKSVAHYLIHTRRAPTNSKDSGLSENTGPHVELSS